MNLGLTAAMLDKVVLRRSDDQHRTRRFGNDLFCGRSPQRPRQSATSVRDHGDQVDIIITNGARDLRRRLTLDDYWIDLDSIEKRVAKQVF